MPPEQSLAERAVEIFHNRSFTPAQRTQGFIDNMIKDPEAWVTGSDPATGAQLAYLITLTTAAAAVGDSDAQDILARIKAMKESGEITMSKSQASQWIGSYRDLVGFGST